MAGNPRHIIRDPKIDNNYLAYINNLSTGNNTTNVTSSHESIKQYVKTKNGIFNGAFGSVGESLAISSGRLNLTANSTGAIVIRRMIYVLPESGTSDTLDNIELTGLELPYQELTLISSTSNTITIAHNGSAGGTSKNIYCPGDTSYVLAPNEAVKLIYDPINTLWLVTGNASSSGGVTNPVNASLDLGGNSIQKVTTLFLNGDIDNANFIAGNTGGLDYNVDDTDEHHDFAVDNVAKLRIGNTAINAYVALDITGNLTTSGELILTGSALPTSTNTSITSYTGDMNYNALTNDSHFFRIDGTVEVEIDADGVDIRNGWLELEERNEPSAPTTDHLRIYAQELSGKTRLMVRFPTGFSQQIAIEP
jgi:hypothetical protein